MQIYIGHSGLNYDDLRGEMENMQGTDFYTYVYTYFYAFIYVLDLFMYLYVYVYVEVTQA
jgi:hypothetical protein